MFKNFYSIGEAALLLGVSVVTMRRWAASSQLACTRTLGGHRRFKHDDLFPKENDGLTLLYARVSSRDQVEDLARQTDTLQARGGQVIVADRYFPSSKKCSHCDWVFKQLKQGQKKWTCMGCNTVHDRDVNAAHNLCNVG